MPLLDLHAKKALITGGGSGICLSLVQALYERGCDILVCDVTLHSTAQNWLKQIPDRESHRVIFRQADVTDWRQLDDLFDAFESHFHDAPDIVVAGAGLYEPSSNSFWDDRDQASHYKVFDVNILHPIKLSRIAIRRMHHLGKPGAIVHLSSITAQLPSVVNPLYAASKAAISHFVRCMAPLGDLANIRVLAVAPGVVDTPLFRDNPKALAHIDIEKDFMLPPEEVVKAIIALLENSNYSSGTILEVGDIGGWRPVKVVHDEGPQGRSTLPRAKAQEALSIVKNALHLDKSSGRDRSRL